MNSVHAGSGRPAWNLSRPCPSEPNDDVRAVGIYVAADGYLACLRVADRFVAGAEGFECAIEVGFAPLPNAATASSISSRHRRRQHPDGDMVRQAAPRAPTALCDTPQQ